MESLWIDPYGGMAVFMIPNLLFVINCKEGFVNLWHNKTVEILEQIGRFGCFGFMIINLPYTYTGFWFDGGEIWFEHLDGMYTYTDLAIQQLREDWLIWKRPSAPSLFAVNLDETRLKDSLLEELTGKMLSPEKRLLRVVFVGVGRADVQKLKKALCGAPFALGFENDFEKAKKWLIGK